MRERFVIANIHDVWHNPTVARPSGIAFLLAQLGAHTADRFGARLAELDLMPAHVGVLRIVGQNPGLSQQALSERLGALPSRVVRLVDELEDRGLVERRRSTTDRRNYELHMATSARERLGAVMAAVGEHDAEITQGLTAAERKTLLTLLGKVAAEQGLNPEAHPAYGSRRRPGST
ncbi:MAG: MarR family transcriptional regulator [Nocardioides sp.]|nr:MarR family transcriptional regulator [Nocardioides sp.]